MPRIILGIGVLQVVVVLINMVRTKLVAVILGPQGVGVIGVVDQLVQIVLYVSTLSLPFAAVRFLSRAHSDGPDAFRNSYATFLRTLLALTTVGFGLGGVVAWFRPELLGPELANYRAFLIPAMVAVPAMACQGLFSNVLAAALRTHAAAIMTVVIAVALTSSSFIGVTTGGILGLYWANLVATLAVTVGIAAYLWKSLDLRPWVAGQGIRQELKRNPDIVMFALTFYANSIIYTLSFFAARYSILSSFGETEAGLLQAGIAVFTSLNLVLGRATGLYLMPLVNRRIPTDEKLRATRDFERKHWLIVLFAAMPIVLFPHWLLVVLFSPSFLAIGGVVTLFAIAQCLQLMSGNYETLLIGLDDLRVYGFLSILGHAAVAAFAWLLAPAYGLVGVGAGFVLGYGLRYAVTTLRLTMHHGLRLERRWWLTFAYGLTLLSIAGAVSANLDPWSPVVTVGKGVFYAAFCVSLLALLDRHELRDLVERGQRLLFPAGPEHASRRGGMIYRRLTERFFPEAWRSGTAPMSAVAQPVVE